MLTEKDYCDYDTSITLTKLGYKTEKVNLRLNKRLCVEQYPKILLYEAQKWLREEYNLHIEVRWYSNMWYEYEVKEAEGKVAAEGCAFPTYEEALSTAVRMAVEYLKER